MRIHYISPSLLPSRSANSVHVIQQCSALAALGMKVTLYAKRTVADEQELHLKLKENYGVEPDTLELKTYYSASTRGDTMRIAVLSLLHTLIRHKNEVVLSRNLYAAYVLAILLRRSIFFETHQIEIGFRKLMQRALLTCPRTTTVVISKKLADILEDDNEIKIAHPLVLHDAAPAGIRPLPPAIRRHKLAKLVGETLDEWQLVCGYFGHLYPGRGIEIIEAMAAKRPNCLFLLYGGNDADVIRCRNTNALNNIQYMGHVPHPVAQQAMLAVDVLLMPYQKEVSIGVAGHDTARWMSPMKMFEYMATGVPIISSDLPVLHEVLEHEQNCLMVAPAEADAWIGALDRFNEDKELAISVGQTAHDDYARHHTWHRRAEALVNAARGHNA